VLELRHVEDDSPENLLGQVVGLVGRHTLAPQPAADQGGIHVHQSPPRGVIAPIAEPLQERGGGLSHAVVLRGTFSVGYGDVGIVPVGRARRTTKPRRAGDAVIESSIRHFGRLSQDFGEAAKKRLSR
jgi:hypothetical protein